ncbi:MAG: hypothetical protein OXE57_21085 [Alphaproteobacteria bacterium]|nr:hypothetical protein [Alphaproteobacteria bacterium]
MTGKRARGFYCTREERSAMGARAAAAGLSVSRLVLDLVHDDIADGPDSGLTAEEMAELLDGLRVLAAYVDGLRDRTAEDGAPRTVPGSDGRHHGDVGDRDCGTPAERVRLSVSATDEEWAAVHERARRSGLSISRYLVGLVLPDAGLNAAPLPALSGVEQREVLEAVRHMPLLLSEGRAPGAGSTGTPDRSSASPDTEEAAFAGDGRMKELHARASAGPDGGHVETDDAGPRSPPLAAGSSKPAETGETGADPKPPGQGALF